jgi:VWFA-related protein
MFWRWTAVLAMVSSVSLSGARGQQQGQAGTPTATESTQSEISTQHTDFAIKVQVNLVLVRVVVRDSAGRAVPGLKQEDFQVFDNGKRQKISSFNAETADSQAKTAANAVVETSEGPTGEATTAVVKTPAFSRRFLALVFDDLHMKAADAMAVRAAATKLFASLTPTDRAAIYSTSGDVKQDFTDDAETLRKTLAAIVPHPGKFEGAQECPNVTYYQADLIVNKHDRDAGIVAALDAEANQCPVDVIADAGRILEQGDSLTHGGYERLEDIVKHLASMPGQRLLVYVSPGFPLPDEVMPDNSSLIEQAIRAGVVVNTIDARGLYTADMLPDIDAPPQAPPPAPPLTSMVGDYQAEEGKYRMQAQFESGQVLAGLAASTGGRYFHNRNDLDVAMSQALEAPSVSYVLGFRPEKPPVNGKFHSLKVKVANGKKYRIQATNGYYASKILVDSEDAAKQEVREALFSRDETASIPVQLQTQFLKTDTPSAQLAVLTHVDIRGIRFRRENGKSCDDLVLATGLFDANGQLVDGQMKDVALKLSDSALQKMNQTGLTIKTVLTVKPGTYRVRGVVRDSEGKQLTARNLMTEFPGKQSKESKRNVSFQNLQWAPPQVDARLKSLSTIPTCNLSDVLTRAAANALALASNLEKFTAQEHIDYVMLDRAGMVEQYDSGWFQYVYSIEQQDGGSVSREYRTPMKGSHAFPAAGQHVGGAAIALMFLPDLQTDYEMRCEGVDERNGQLDWVVHFQQRKDRPSRTVKVWVSDIARPGMVEGRAWISKENYQVVHLEANLMDGVPDIGLQGLAASVDYGLVQSASGSLGMWLPDSIATYWDYDAHRTILVHRLSDFQFFTVETQEKVQESREP